MAQKDIEISEPYFKLLASKTIKKQLRNILVQQAPREFYSVLTQITRHILNGTFCSENPLFCEKYDTALYILSLPSTTKKNKQKILLTESSDFIDQLFQSLTDAISKS